MILEDLSQEIISIQKELVKNQFSINQIEKDNHDEMIKLFLGIVDFLDLLDTLLSNSDLGSHETLGKIRRRVSKLLAAHNVLEIPFSPNQMDPNEIRVLSQENIGENSDGSLKVVRKGYKWCRYVLRPTEVIGGMLVTKSPSSRANTERSEVGAERSPA